MLSQELMLVRAVSQQCKIYRHTKFPIGTFSNPDARFSHIHINLVGRMPICQDYHIDGGGLLLMMAYCSAN